MRQVLLRLDRWITGLALNGACLLLAIVAGLGFWQVITRFVLSQPSIWTEEALRRLLIWCVMLGVVAAFRHGALVSVDLMLRLSRGWYRRFVRHVITWTTLTFLGVIVWFGTDLAYRVRFQTFAAMDSISMAWAYAALPVGALLSMVAVLGQHLEARNTELENAL